MENDVPIFAWPLLSAKANLASRLSDEFVLPGSDASRSETTSPTDKNTFRPLGARNALSEQSCDFADRVVSSDRGTLAFQVSARLFRAGPDRSSQKGTLG